MAAIEPTPRHRRSRPSSASLKPARAFTNGTRGTQAAVPIPTIRKMKRVDHAPARLAREAVAWRSVAVRAGIGTGGCDSG